MARSRSKCRLLGQLCLIAVLIGLVLCQSDGQRPTNVTVIPRGTDSLEVKWAAPDVPDLTQNLESYRVRIYPENQEDLKRVYWVRPSILQQTVACLEPNAVYEVQVFARYFKDRNLTDGGSELVRQSTLLPTTEVADTFLNLLQEHGLYIGIGAGLMAVLILLFSPLIWCCCCRKGACSCRGKTGKMNMSNAESQDGETRGKKKKKKTSDASSPPSAKELQEREMARLPRSSSDNRYTSFPDPVQNVSYRPHPSDVSTTNSQATLIRPERSTSIPYEPAPARPPMPAAWTQQGDSNLHDEVFESDPPDYENSMFGGCGPAEQEVYANQEFFHQQPAEEFPVYGNCQF